MKYAIMSDIHGNLESSMWAAEDARKRKTAIYFSCEMRKYYAHESGFFIPHQPSNLLY